MGDRSAHYLSRVLRVTVDQTVVLFNGDGHDYVAEVVRPGKKEVSLWVVSRLPAVRESGLKITVVQAISRGERMDQTLQKCTELGAAAFQPLFSERVEVRIGAEKLARRLEHWQGVVISACEQSGRAVIPRVLRPLGFTDWLAQGDAGRRLVLEETSQSLDLGESAVKSKDEVREDEKKARQAAELQMALAADGAGGGQPPPQ